MDMVSCPAFPSSGACRPFDRLGVVGADVRRFFWGVEGLSGEECWSKSWRATWALPCRLDGVLGGHCYVSHTTYQLHARVLVCLTQDLGEVLARAEPHVFFGVEAPCGARARIVRRVPLDHNRLAHAILFPWLN